VSKTKVIHWLQDECTPAVANLAKQRVSPLLHNWHLMDYSIERILISAYLQAMADAVQTLATRPECIGVEKIPHDFQI
jgi:hypothetical protein